MCHVTTELTQKKYFDRQSSKHRLSSLQWIMAKKQFAVNRNLQP